MDRTAWPKVERVIAGKVLMKLELALEREWILLNLYSLPGCPAFFNLNYKGFSTCSVLVESTSAAPSCFRLSPYSQHSFPKERRICKLGLTEYTLLSKNLEFKLCNLENVIRWFFRAFLDTWITGFVPRKRRTIDRSLLSTDHHTVWTNVEGVYNYPIQWRIRQRHDDWKIKMFTLGRNLISALQVGPRYSRKSPTSSLLNWNRRIFLIHNLDNCPEYPLEQLYDSKNLVRCPDIYLSSILNPNGRNLFIFMPILSNVHFSLHQVILSHSSNLPTPRTVAWNLNFIFFWVPKGS